MKKITFFDAILDPSYGPLMNILSNCDSRIYEDCVLATRKKAVDIEGNERDAMFFVELV